MHTRTLALLRRARATATNLLGKRQLYYVILYERAQRVVVRLHAIVCLDVFTFVVGVVVVDFVVAARLGV